MVSAFIVSLFILFAIALPAQRSTINTVPFRIDSLFQELHAQGKFNGNVLVARDNEIVYSKVFGYADFEHKKPLTIQSIFEVGSITKQFTAIVVMMLYENGKLDLNDPVKVYIPEFPYEGITIHHLLTHRSGLPEYMRFAKKYWKNKKQVMTNKDLLNILIKYRPALLFSPDEDYYYSNTGYALLASVIERISGLKYSNFLENKIFKTLDMNNTFVFRKQKAKYYNNIAFGYDLRQCRVREDYLCGIVGDKGIYSSVEDLLKWDNALYSEKLVKQETLAKAFTPYSYDKNNDRYYGYGWRIAEINGCKIFYHAGQWNGYNSLILRRHYDKSTIIILSNKRDSVYEELDVLVSMLDSKDGTVGAKSNGF